MPVPNRGDHAKDPRCQHPQPDGTTSRRPPPLGSCVCVARSKFKAILQSRALADLVCRFESWTGAWARDAGDPAALVGLGNTYQRLIRACGTWQPALAEYGRDDEHLGWVLHGFCIELDDGRRFGEILLDGKTPVRNTGPIPCKVVVVRSGPSRLGWSPHAATTRRG